MKALLFGSVLGAVALVGHMAAAQEVDAPGMRIYAVEGDFADVRLDVESAIINRGLVIDHESFVGEMLNRTAEDVGAETQVYTQADTFQFCSATVSRRMMEADPATLAYCPFVIFVYELADAEGTVHVGYRRPPQDGALVDVDQFIDEIVRDAAGI